MARICIMDVYLVIDQCIHGQMASLESGCEHRYLSHTHCTGTRGQKGELGTGARSNGSRFAICTHLNFSAENS